MTTEIRVLPKAARKARETIRKHDPALAMLLDVIIPVEVCIHDWPKAQRPQNPWGIRYKCLGCGEYVKPMGTKSNYWVTEEEWHERSLKMVQVLKEQHNLSEVEY